MRSDLPLDFSTIGKLGENWLPIRSSNAVGHGRTDGCVIGGRSRPSVRLLSDHAVCDHHGRKGGVVRDSIADIERLRPGSPGWPASIGMGNRLPSESVAGLRRNQWPLWVGLRTPMRRNHIYQIGWIAYRSKC